MKENKSISHKTFGTVAILYGGFSSERVVSLQSGECVYNALQEVNIDSVLIDTKTDLVNKLIQVKPDIVFIALHGEGGEDGSIQGLLDLMGIPYTGSGMKASMLAMDKFVSKIIWEKYGLPTPEYKLIDKSSDVSLGDIVFPLPCFVKPNSGGSSLGMSKVTCHENLKPAVELALNYGDQVLIEQFIEGKEFTVGIVNDEALPVIRVETKNEFYDYDAKYVSDATVYHIPSGLSDSEDEKIKKIAKNAFESFGCKNWGRVDLIQDSVGGFWLIEVNTIPGLTTHSLIPKAAKAYGYAFGELIVELLDGAHLYRDDETYNAVNKIEMTCL